MKFALTGRPGIGKTTVVKKLAEALGSRAVGFWTQELRRGGRRVGFELVRTDGKRALLASVDRPSPYRVGRYFIYPEVLDSLAVPFLEEALGEPEGKVFLIDEVGKMELLSPSFVNLIEKLIDAELDAVLTVPLKTVHPVVARIKNSGKFKLIHLTEKNRDSVPERILKALEGRDGEKGEEGS
jgi:nucleoside-triphosphatase